MAFKSIGQKYGFVSAGDVFRWQIADAEARADDERRKADEERQNAEKSEAEKLNAARRMVQDKVISIENAMIYFGYAKEQILTKWKCYNSFVFRLSSFV